MNLLIKLLKKIKGRFLRHYHEWFSKTNYIFSFKGTISPEKRTDCEFLSYKSFESLPEQTRIDMCEDGSIIQLNQNKLELEENAILWIASVNSHMVSFVFTRQGKYFKNWFVPLQPTDIVFFRLGTNPSYRGRGYATSLIRYVMHELETKEALFYIDIRTYNRPSIRCVEKTGWLCIGKKKSIDRNWAMYG